MLNMGKNKLKSKRQENKLLKECELVLQDLMEQLKECIKDRDSRPQIQYKKSSGAYSGVGSLKNECTGCKARLFG